MIKTSGQALTALKGAKTIQVIPFSVEEAPFEKVSEPYVLDMDKDVPVEYASEGKGLMFKYRDAPVTVVFDDKGVGMVYLTAVGGGSVNRSHTRATDGRVLRGRELQGVGAAPPKLSNDSLARIAVDIYDVAWELKSGPAPELF